MSSKPSSKTVQGIEFVRNDEDDAEYNEHKAEIDGHDVVVASDRDGKRWHCIIDDGELLSLDADNLEWALRDAIETVRN